MTDADAVRRVALALPRAYEREVRGRSKLKVGQIVFTAFSADELVMGFGFPRTERDGLVASAPEKFFLPSKGDLRYQWVCARLPALDDDEMRELVVDAWRMCVPAMLHDLPELPFPAARVWDLVDRQEWAQLRPLLHPYVHFTEGATHVRGRSRLLAHLAERTTPKPPTEVEVRDGHLYRWIRR
jgi:hypothetical protein